MTSCLVVDKEEEQMRNIFQCIDQDYDYQLTKAEFQDGLSKMGLADAKKSTDEIFKLVDSDNSGQI